MAKKYAVSLTMSVFYDIPVQAENAKEAEQKAREILDADPDYPCAYDCIELSEFDGDPPAVWEVDDGTFWRGVATPPEVPEERAAWTKARAPLSKKQIAELDARLKARCAF
jgi:hypothetical protein